MLRNPNRFLVKQVESARRRRVRAEAHADRMELQRLRAADPMPASTGSAPDLSDLEFEPETDLVEAAAELGIDLSGVTGAG
jgi:hypothetical protein